MKQLLKPKPKALLFVDKPRAANKRTARDGCCGIYFDVTCGAIPVRIDGIIAGSRSTSSVQIFVCNGSCAGQEHDEDAWTLVSLLSLAKRNPSGDSELSNLLEQQEEAGAAFANLSSAAPAAEKQAAADALAAASAAVKATGAHQWDQTLVDRMLHIKEAAIQIRRNKEGAVRSKLPQQQLDQLDAQAAALEQDLRAVEQKLQAIAPVLNANQTKGFLVLGTDAHQHAVGIVRGASAQTLETKLKAVVTNCIGLKTPTPFADEKENNIISYRMAKLTSRYQLSSKHKPAEITWATNGFFFDIENTSKEAVLVEAINIAGKEKRSKVTMWSCDVSYKNNEEEQSKWQKVATNIISKNCEITTTTLAKHVTIPAGKSKGFYLHSVESEGIGAVRLLQVVLLVHDTRCCILGIIWHRTVGHAVCVVRVLWCRRVCPFATMF